MSGVAGGLSQRILNSAEEFAHMGHCDRFEANWPRDVSSRRNRTAISCRNFDSIKRNLSRYLFVVSLADDVASGRTSKGVLHDLPRARPATNKSPSSEHRVQCVGSESV